MMVGFGLVKPNKESFEPVKTSSEISYTDKRSDDEDEVKEAEMEWEVREEKDGGGSKPEI